MTSATAPAGNPGPPAPATPAAEGDLCFDGRLSPAAAAIVRGVRRMLSGHGMTSLCEVTLPNGRRADVAALDAKSEIAIIEIKSSLADFRADAKWPEYREFCDTLSFAVAPDFPLEILPDDVGIIVADRFGGEWVRLPPRHPLSPARRRSLLLRLTRLAMMRLHRAEDPDHALEIQFGD